MQPFFAPGNIIGKDYHISTGTKVLPGSFSKAASAAVSWPRLRRPNVLEADLAAGCPARPLQVALSSDPPPPRPRYASADFFFFPIALSRHFRVLVTFYLLLLCSF